MKLRASVAAMIDSWVRRSREIGSKQLEKGPQNLPSRWQRRVPCCSMCSAATDFYMAEDEVWEEAGFSKNELVCLYCLQQSLGRPLVITDFTTAQINLPLLWAFQMGIKHASRTSQYQVPLQPEVATPNQRVHHLPLT